MTQHHPIHRAECECWRCLDADRAPDDRRHRAAAWFLTFYIGLMVWGALITAAIRTMSAQP